MNLLKDLLPTHLSQVRSKRTEYGDLLTQFQEKLNPVRVFQGYAPLTLGRIGKELKKGNVTPSKMYSFYKECERSNNFSKYFWWKIKQNKHESHRKNEAKVTG